MLDDLKTFDPIAHSSRRNDPHARIAYEVLLNSFCPTSGHGGFLNARPILASIGTGEFGSFVLAWTDLPDPAAKTPATTPSRMLAEIKEGAGLTWEQVARILGVDRRSVHLWLRGQGMSADREERLHTVAHVIREIDAGTPSETRGRLLDKSAGTSVFDLLLGAMTRKHGPWLNDISFREHVRRISPRDRQRGEPRGLSTFWKRGDECHPRSRVGASSHRVQLVAPHATPRNGKHVSAWERTSRTSSTSG